LVFGQAAHCDVDALHSMRCAEIGMRDWQRVMRLEGGLRCGTYHMIISSTWYPNGVGEL
jgi:hypothetical protein